MLRAAQIPWIVICTIETELQPYLQQGGEAGWSQRKALGLCAVGAGPQERHCRWKYCTLSSSQQEKQAALLLQGAQADLQSMAKCISVLTGWSKSCIQP